MDDPGLTGTMGTLNLYSGVGDGRERLKSTASPPCLLFRERCSSHPSHRMEMPLSLLALTKCHVICHGPVGGWGSAVVYGVSVVGEQLGLASSQV